VCYSPRREVRISIGTEYCAAKPRRFRPGLAPRSIAVAGHVGLELGTCGSLQRYRADRGYLNVAAAGVQLKFKATLGSP